MPTPADREAASGARFHRSVRSYAKLVALIEQRDRAGAERHWLTHMEAASLLLRGDLRTARLSA